MKVQANPVQQFVLIITALHMVPVVHADRAVPFYQWATLQTTTSLYQAPVTIEPDGSLTVAGLCRYPLQLSDQYLAGIWVDDGSCLPLPDDIGQEEFPPEYLVQKPYRQIPFNQTSTGNLQAIADYAGFQGSATEQAGINSSGIFPCFYTRQSRQLMGLAMTTHNGLPFPDCYALFVQSKSLVWGARYSAVAYLSPEYELPYGKGVKLSDDSEDESDSDNVFIITIFPILLAGLCALPSCWCFVQICKSLGECRDTSGPPCRACRTALFQTFFQPLFQTLFQTIAQGIMAIANFCMECPQCCSNLIASGIATNNGEAVRNTPFPASTGEVAITVDSEPGLSAQVIPPDSGETTSLPDYDSATTMPAYILPPPYSAEKP